MMNIDKKIADRKKEIENNKKKIIAIYHNNIDKMLKPAYVKYTKEHSMSPVDPSFIYPLITGGVRKPKLSTKMPVIKKKYENIYEYAFDENDRCLYCKFYTSNHKAYLNTYYIYDENVIYRIHIQKDDIDDTVIQDLKPSHFYIYEKYEFDDKKRPLKVICDFFALERYEKY